MSSLVKATTPIQDFVWDESSQFLQNALDKTKNLEWNIDDVREYVDSGRGILLVVKEDDGDVSCALVCGIAYYVRKKCFEIFLMGADVGTDWDDHFPMVMEIAKAEGCDYIRVSGRRWVRFFSKYGSARELYQSELEL